MKKILVLVLVLFALTAQATVTVTTSTAGPFTCNAVTVAFPFSFKIIAATDLVVVKRNVSSGVLTTLTNVTDYTVAGMGGSSGTVTLTSGSKCDAAYTLTITRTTPLTQTTSFTTQGAYLPKTHETALDKLTLGLQDYARLSSALVGPQGPQGEVGAPGTVTAASGLILQSNGFDITIAGPPTLAADYALTLPAALPASTKPLTITAAGQILTDATPTIIRPAIEAGWTNGTGDAAFGYWKDLMGMVHLVGKATRDSGATSILATLPVGYRPADSRYFSVTASVWGGMDWEDTSLRVIVYPSGAVGVSASAANDTHFWFDSVHFLAEQ